MEIIDGVMCVHCRFFKDEININLQNVGNHGAAPKDLISVRINQAICAVPDQIVKVQGGIRASVAFSVVLDNECTFITLSHKHNSSIGQPVIVSCTNSFYQFGRTRALHKFATDCGLCPHLTTLQQRPVLWAEYARQRPPCPSPTPVEDDAAMAAEGEVAITDDLPEDTDAMQDNSQVRLL